MNGSVKTMALALVAGLTATAAAAAQDKPMGERYNYYISGMGGVNFMEDDDAVTFTDLTVPGALTGGFNADTGWAAGGAVGAFLPKAFRVEIEGAYRDGDVDATILGITIGTASVKTWSVLFNVVKDFPLGTRLTPYLGAGGGVAHPKVSGDLCSAIGGGCPFSTSDTNFAYQGIAGLSFDITDNVQLFADYRYFGVFQPSFNDLLNGVGVSDVRDRNHTVMGGIRLAFGPKAAPAPVAAAPQPKNYLVFFDFDHSDLTTEGGQVVATAAKDAIDGKAVSLDVVGHADRSGTDDYNMGLSERRANTVKGELVRLGVPESAIQISWKGESEPLVATADGVREPQNRRASITINFGK